VLTASQVCSRLPVNPGKAADSQAVAFIRRHGALVQVELDALDPAELRGLGQAAIGQLLRHVHLRGGAPRRAARPRVAAGPGERREQLTPNRSAGRIEDELCQKSLPSCSLLFRRADCPIH
jgi:hypothetical protein